MNSSRVLNPFRLFKSIIGGTPPGLWKFVIGPVLLLMEPLRGYENHLVRFPIIGGTPPGLCSNYFFQILTLPDEIPHSSRCAGSIRNDISFLHGRGTDVAVRLANRHICPYNSLNALSFRALARNLPLPLPITFGVIPSVSEEPSPDESGRAHRR